MDKNIRELVDLNGAIILSVNENTIITKIYQANSQTKYQESDVVKVDLTQLPFSNGHYSLRFESDIIQFINPIGVLNSEKEFYLKETFIWLLEKATPYLDKIAKELTTEIILTQTYDEETKTFESYASLSDDIPVLFVSITPNP